MSELNQKKKKDDEGNNRDKRQEGEEEVKELQEAEVEDSVISLEAAGHLSSNVAAHLVVVRLGWHWYTAFEAREKEVQLVEDSRLTPLFCLTSCCR